MKTLRGFVLTTVMISAAWPLSGANAHAAKPLAKLGPFSEIPADLPAGFYGHDVKAVLGKAFASKGEFETTDEYMTRRTETVRPGVYMFVWNNAVPTYDADQRALTFRLPTSKLLLGFALTGVDGYQIALNSIAQRQYQATNGFGARFTVSVLAGTEYVIARKDADEVVSLLEIIVPRGEAAHMKASLRPAIICRITKDDLLPPAEVGDAKSAATGFMHRDATFTEPTDFSMFQFGVRSEVLSLVIVDEQAHHIVQRYDADGHVGLGSRFRPVRNISVGQDQIEVLDIAGRQPDGKHEEIVDDRRVESWDFNSLGVVVWFDPSGKVYRVDYRLRQ